MFKMFSKSLLFQHNSEAASFQFILVELSPFSPQIQDVIEAIAESAFKTSPYPVILSFENHVDS